jgi:protein-S-isoprenylcysteine O-methyltransferase Ste14
MLYFFVQTSMATFSQWLIPSCWVTFLLYWLVMARRVKATAEMQSLFSAMLQRIPLGLSYYLMLAWWLPPDLDRVVTTHTDWARAAGDLVCVLGLFVTLWARRTLAGNWSSDVTFKQDHELIRTGPYRFARHPIYTGLLLMCLGTAIAIARVRGWLALPLMALAFWIKLSQEERLLLRHFPDAYPAYKKQVKAIVPFIL